MKTLQEIATAVRRAVIEMSFRGKGGHVGCSLSCTDIIVALYFSVMKIDAANPTDMARDRFILSKGHSVAALYAALAEKGFFGKEKLATYFADGSPLAGHAVFGSVPGIEASTGSEGHGLSLGIGMAIAARAREDGARVFVLTGDGEMEEGSTWEAIMVASRHALSNLVMIVDYNQLQIMGNPEEIAGLVPLDEKFKAFHWDVDTVDGHDHDALVAILQKRTERPHAIIARTTKGKGVSFMEGKVEWHGKTLGEEEYKTAIKELSA